LRSGIGFSFREEYARKFDPPPRVRKCGVAPAGKIVIERAKQLTAGKLFAIFLRDMKRVCVGVMALALVDEPKLLAFRIVEIDGHLDEAFASAIKIA